jgi:hypothetical protein
MLRSVSKLPSSSSLVAPATPSVTLNAAALARRMSFTAAANDNTSVTLSGAMAKSTTFFADDEDMDAANADGDEQNDEVDTSDGFGGDRNDDESGDGALSVPAFFRACNIHFAPRHSVSRQSSANGFVQRDERRSSGAAAAMSERETLMQCVLEATELETLERSSARWQAVMEQLKTNVDEAAQFFRQQPPPVMQMLALVPDEQRPAFVDCMQQLQQKCVAEARWQSAQRRLEDETEALQMWNEQLAAVRTDLAAANAAVDTVAQRGDAQRHANAARAATAAAVTDPSSALCMARTALADGAAAIEGVRAQTRECDAALIALRAQCEAARGEAEATEAEAALMRARHSAEARAAAAKAEAEAAAKRARSEAAAALREAKCAVRAECDVLLQAGGAFAIVSAPMGHSSGSSDAETESAPIVTLAFADAAFAVDVVFDAVRARLVAHGAVHAPAGSRHAHVDRGFLAALLRSARLDAIAAGGNSKKAAVAAAPTPTAAVAIKQHLPAFVRAVDLRLGRAAELLDEVARLQSAHGLCVTLGTFAASTAETASATATVRVSIMHAAPASMSMSEHIERLLSAAAADPSEESVAPRVEVEFDVCAQYPHAPLGRRLVELPLQSAERALCDAQPSRLLQRVVDGSQGFGRLTKICLALQKRVPAAYA